MPGIIETRLSELDIILPSPPLPIASYTPYVQAGKLLFISGQLAFVENNASNLGILGKSLGLIEGQLASKNAALNVLAQLKHACHGDLDVVKKCVSLRVYVASASGFTDHASVADSASDLIKLIFNEKGLHSRAAVGVSVLPRNSAVEIESIWEME